MLFFRSHHLDGPAAACKYSFSLILIFIVCLNVGAQRLSFHNYSVHDGLANAHVNSVYQDRKGYLWFGTWEGLSRFDGYGFTNYGRRDGLANPIINDITEDRDGNLWVATQTGGVARLIDDPKESSSLPQDTSDTTTRKKFINYSMSDKRESNVVGALLFDAENTLWCVTEGGIYRARVPTGNQRFDLKFELVGQTPADKGWTGYALADNQGRLWFGFYDELIEFSEGRITKYHLPDKLDASVISIQSDWHGGLFVASHVAVFDFLPPTDVESKEQWRKLPLALMPRPEEVYTMLSEPNDTLWLGTSHGLIKYQDGRQTRMTTAQGLSENHVSSLFKDREENLWIGTGIGGVSRLSNEKIVSFTSTEGLLSQNISMLVEDHTEHIYASALSGGIFELSEDKATLVAGSQAAPFNLVGKRILQDVRGDWWVGTEAGLFRFQGPRLQLEHGEKFKSADGIPESPVFNGPGMYEDSSGKVWVGLQDFNLYWFDPARKGQAPLFQHLNLQDVWQSYARDIVQDRAGALWVGGFGGMLRLVDDKPVRIEPTDGLPEANPRALFLDSRGWLWIGLRFNGVSVVKDTGASPMKFINYSTANGLSSDAVWSIT